MTSFNGLSVRDATPNDVSSLVAIYNFEVVHSAANYESEPQRIEERARWLADLTTRGYPVLVAEYRGSVAGFAALTPFHPLRGYRKTVTGSIYVHHAHRGQGIGAALGEAMLQAARDRGYHSILGGVNSNNRASLALLESFGFERVGYFREIGEKQGVWYDDVCLQKLL